MLEQVQQTAKKMIRGLEYLSHGGETERAGTAQPGKRGEWYQCLCTWWKGIEKMETDASQRCPVAEEAAVGMHWNARNSVQTWEKDSFVVRVEKRWHRLPDKVLDCLWPYSKPSWTRCWAPALADCALSREFDYVVSRGPFPPQQFCDALNVQCTQMQLRLVVADGK